MKYDFTVPQSAINMSKITRSKGKGKGHPRTAHEVPEGG